MTRRQLLELNYIGGARFAELVTLKGRQLPSNSLHFPPQFMAYYPAHTITGQMIIRDTENGKWFLSQMENDSFRSVIAKLYDHMGTVTFNCCDDAYQWVCDQAGIDTFVADEWAWNCFFEVYLSAKSDR